MYGPKSDESLDRNGAAIPHRYANGTVLEFAERDAAGLEVPGHFVGRRVNEEALHRGIDQRLFPVWTADPGDGISAFAGGLRNKRVRFETPAVHVSLAPSLGAFRRL
jgi:hypothetical protein